MGCESNRSSHTQVGGFNLTFDWKAFWLMICSCNLYIFDENYEFLEFSDLNSTEKIHK